MVTNTTVRALLEAGSLKGKERELASLAVVASIMVDNSKEREDILGYLTKSLVRKAFEAGFDAGATHGAYVKMNGIKAQLELPVYHRKYSTDEKQEFLRFLLSVKDQLKIDQDELDGLDENWSPADYKKGEA